MEFKRRWIWSSGFLTCYPLPPISGHFLLKAPGSPPQFPRQGGGAVCFGRRSLTAMVVVSTVCKCFSCPLSHPSWLCSLVETSGLWPPGKIAGTAHPSGLVSFHWSCSWTLQSCQLITSLTHAHIRLCGLLMGTQIALLATACSKTHHPTVQCYWPSLLSLEQPESVCTLPTYPGTLSSSIRMHTTPTI